MNYQSALTRHLVKYKHTVLGIAEPGLYRHRGVNLRYDHILPINHRYSNLLTEAEPLARLFIQNQRGKLHRYFHHLNSSQALAFNLFLPFFSSGSMAAAALLRAFGQQSELAEWRLEDIPDKVEETNIDAWWKTTDQVQTFCEVKLSETRFGTAKVDDKHLTKLRNIYAGQLRPHLKASQLEPKAFFRNYQFYRNIWHMVGTNRSRLVFLMPKANTGLWKDLDALLPGVGPETRERISAVSIEDVLKRIAVDEDCPEIMRGYAVRLAEKYIIS
jgi:hypothetical protein